MIYSRKTRELLDDKCTSDMKTCKVGGKKFKAFKILREETIKAKETPNLDQFENTSHLLDLHASLLIEADPPSVQDGAGNDCVPQCRQPTLIKLCKSDLLLVKKVAGVDELFE